MPKTATGYKGGRGGGGGDEGGGKGGGGEASLVWKNIKDV
jgi:hypothetical protein